MKASLWLGLILWFWCILQCATVIFPRIDPDERRNLHQLVESRGFLLQEHQVTTADGYILMVHRVVPKDYDPAVYSTTRKPVILGHCLYCSSEVYFVNSPFLNSNSSKCGDNFGFCLVMDGKYDVWVPNFRGNKHSLKHVRLSSWDRRYWRFSFQQKAEFDLPAIIEMVRDKTGHETVAYVGFSQGTVMMFALLSERPEYANIVQPFIAWGPGLFLGYGNGIWNRLAIFGPMLHSIGGPFIPLGTRIQRPLCRRTLIAYFCSAGYDQIFGESLHWNLTRFPVYMKSTSHGSNWESVHIFQLSKARRLVKFDYGSPGANRRAYDQPTPPAYPIDQISSNAKIVLINGRTDLSMTPEDVEMQYTFLLSIGVDVTHHEVKSKTWGHLDFIFGQNAGKYVYDPTLEFLDQFI